MSDTGPSLLQRMRARLRRSASRLGEHIAVWGEALLEIVFFWR